MNASVIEQLSTFIKSIPRKENIEIRSSVVNIQTIIDDITSIDLDVIFYNDKEKEILLKIRCSHIISDNYIINVKLWIHDMEIGSSLDDKVKERIGKILDKNL